MSSEFDFEISSSESEIDDFELEDKQEISKLCVLLNVSGTVKAIVDAIDCLQKNNIKSTLYILENGSYPSYRKYIEDSILRQKYSCVEVRYHFEEKEINIDEMFQKGMDLVANDNINRIIFSHNYELSKNIDKIMNQNPIQFKKKFNQNVLFKIENKTNIENTKLKVVPKKKKQPNKSSNKKFVQRLKERKRQRNIDSKTFQQNKDDFVNMFEEGENTEKIKNEEKIFVMLPTYNRGMKCIKVIDEIRSQDISNWFLYVVDDGSDVSHSNQIRNHVNRLNDPRIELDVNQQNMRLPKTLNRGLHKFLKSACNYFTWISDDNDYYSNFLSNLYNLQSEFVHSAWDNSNCGIIDNEYKSLHQVLYIFNGLASFMWSRSAIQKIGFYNEFLHSVEDYDYLIRTYIHLDNKEIKYSKESGMKYYVNLPSSISVQDCPEHQNKRPILNTFYREITAQEGVHKQKCFVYYSKTTWEKLFQRSHQIMRFMSDEYFKVFITSDNIFKYESKYQLWVIPYKFRHYILHLFNQLETHIYFTDSRLFDEVYYYKKQSNYKILYDLIDAPIEEFQVNMKKCIKNANHVIYSHSKLLKYLNNIDTNKGYHYISNICNNEMVTDKEVCNKIYEIIDKELSIVILCWNQLAYTKQCIESVLKNTKSNNYEIVVVNNGSTDGTYEYLNSLNKDNIKIINNSNNLGFSKGMNIGVKNSIGKYLILLNNDTWVSEGWDVALIDILKYKSNVYAVTPITNLCGNKAMVNIQHDNLYDYFDKILKLKPKLLKNFYIDSLGLFCGAFRRIEFIQMDYLDETYLNGWEDDDFYEKIDIINKKVMVTTDSVVYHYGSITVGANNYSNVNNKNKLYFEKKWDKKWKCHHINQTSIYNSVLITGNTSGGSFRWANSYLEHYILVKNKDDFFNTTINEHTTIFINSFLLSNITINFLSKFKKDLKFKLIIPIHDYYWFCDKLYNDYNPKIHNIYLKKNSKIPTHLSNLYEIVDKFFVSTKTIYDNVKNLIPNKYYNKFLICSNYWYDNYQNSFILPTTKLSSKTINIGCFVRLDECKGLEQVKFLRNNVKTYKNYTLNYFIVGDNIDLYKDNNYSFVQLVNKYNINGFLLLNKWGESWCYSLSKIVLSNLPVFYNNIGAFKDRIKNNSNFVKNIEHENEYHNNISLKQNYFKFLDKIITDDNKKMESNILKFAVYFPQFHKILENDINFYDGYNDIVNLNQSYDVLENERTDYVQDLPNTKYLNGIKTYDILDESLIDKQVDILNKYNINGLAMYYYWFSINTITHKKLIMFDAIEKFLHKNINIFFIWANENWSDNPAFGESKHIIKNEYNDIDEHCLFLIKCFKHKNYYKIKNKPVFYIHHPWLINVSKLNEIYNKLDKICKENNFDGIHLKFNSMIIHMNINLQLLHNKLFYDFNPIYKNSNSNICVNKENCSVLLDYDDYIDKMELRSNTQTIFFDFDNYARLSRPNRLNKRTKCINNNINNHVRYIQKIRKYFNSKPHDNQDPFMLLINAFNEWGEKMHIEPSEKNGTYFLDLISNFFK